MYLHRWHRHSTTYLALQIVYAIFKWAIPGLYFVIFGFSTVNIKYVNHKINRGHLVTDATTLPTEPQPLPYVCNFLFNLIYTYLKENWAGCEVHLGCMVASNIRGPQFKSSFWHISYAILLKGDCLMVFHITIFIARCCKVGGPCPCAMFRKQIKDPVRESNLRQTKPRKRSNLKRDKRKKCSLLMPLTFIV